MTIITDKRLSLFVSNADDPTPEEWRDMAAELLRRRREDTIRANAFDAEVQRRVRAEEEIKYLKRNQADRPPEGPWEVG